MLQSYQHLGSSCHQHTSNHNSIACTRRLKGYIKVQIEPHRTMPSTVILKILSINSAWPMSDSMEDMERFYGVMDREIGYMRKGRGSGSTHSVNAEKQGAEWPH
jgi:hypothetical protein